MIRLELGMSKQEFDKKFNDIFMDTNVMKAYNLGIAVGLLEAYRSCKAGLGEEKTKEIYGNIEVNGIIYHQVISI